MKESSEMTIKIETEQFLNVYIVAAEIGRGKFAVVKRCTHQKTGIDYAAKFIRKRRKGLDCRKDVLHEICMLELTLAHPNFVNLVEVYETTHDLILITELVKGGELFQYIFSEGQLEETCTIKLMRQILSGIKFLHSKNIAHLDIKPQNILLDDQLPNGNVKLCDLGLARNFNSGGDVFEIIGTTDYVAPEILDYQKLNSACDMWSLGVLAYVMLSGFSPFAGDTNQETFLNISQVNLDFPEEHFSKISNDAIDFIRKLLIKEPESRMTASDSLDHPWLKSSTSITTPLTCDSPLGQRRSTSDTNIHEPIKRCRCDIPIVDNSPVDDDVETDVPTQKENINLGDVTVSNEHCYGVSERDRDTVAESEDLNSVVVVAHLEDVDHITDIKDLDDLETSPGKLTSSFVSVKYFELKECHVRLEREWSGEVERWEPSGIPV